MKRTKKYVAAQALVASQGLFVPRLIENAELFSKLEGLGWYWVDGEWTDKRPQTSVFETGDGHPTGIYHLRLMGHPDDLNKIINQLGPQLNILEASKPYPNRKGPGVRVYLMCKI